MDALDGGQWKFGDDSFPEVGVTYFAGTFVRHPLALAASKASLIHLKENGPKLQEDLAALTDSLATELNLYFEKQSLPMAINHYKSLWRLSILEEIPYSELVFVLMRLKGIHIWDGFPCFMTTAYKDEDVTHLINTFIESVEELIAAGIFKSEVNTDEIINGSKTVAKPLNQPPVPGARLGMDEFGNPAWYIADAKNEGSYKKIEL